MKKYQRISQRDKHGTVCVPFTNSFYITQAYERLAELEDKIENGTFYDFRFQLGQKVYIVCDWDIKEPVPGIISEIELTTNKRGSSHRIYVDHEHIYSKTNSNLIAYRYIFREEELFLDKESAEAKLKELQEKLK